MKKATEQLEFNAITGRPRIETIIVYAGELFELSKRVREGGGRIRRMNVKGRSGYECFVEWPCSR